MKNTIIALTIAFSSIVNAQFKIAGEIKNFPEQDLMVRINVGASQKLINKVNTDKNGKFSVNIPEKYSGIVSLSNKATTSTIEILSDNENVNLQSEFNNQLFLNTTFTEGKNAIAFQKFNSFQSYNDLKSNVFPIVKALYNTDDEFFKAIVKEENRISTLNPASELPLLKYYVQVSELANSHADTKPAAEILMNKILNRLVNDNTNLERTGFFSKLVLDYLRYSIVGANNQTQINSTIEKEIDNLLDKTDLETPRGQNVLSAIFQFLPKEQFASLLEKYYAKADALTCEKTDELKSNISAHNLKNPGSLVPNIIFNKEVKGFKSLYDVKANKKIIIFWASWCPACHDEMPFVKEYYQNFKKEGGEIIAISLDFDQNAYSEAIKDFPWINYSDLLQWEGQGVESFGVDATPTLFLVDKDNKLIKKASHISELIDL